MSFESAITFFFAILIFSVTPGPGVFAIMARALVKGYKSCFMLALGMTISDILYLVAACFGLAVIASHWSGAFTVIRVLGAIYLIYLGWMMWKAPIDLSGSESKASKIGLALSFAQGFMISASNPKVILFYIAFLPTFMDLSSLNNHDIILASLLSFVALMIGLMSIALFSSQARRWFHSESATKTLNKSAGSVMMAAGAYLFKGH